MQKKGIFLFVKHKNRSISLPTSFDHFQIWSLVILSCYHQMILCHKKIVKTSTFGGSSACFGLNKIQSLFGFGSAFNNNFVQN